MPGADPKILSQIAELVDEEKSLRKPHRGTPLRSEDMRRLEEIEIQLDQCWDLLDQRRALREFGMDPEQAQTRDQGTVEGYQQ